MGRTARRRPNEPARPKPVEKIELSEKHLKLRGALALVLLLTGAFAIGYGLLTFLGGEPGWTEIESKASELHCGSSFNFMYEVGRGEASAAAENREVTGVYTGATVQAYRLFTNDEEYEDVHNLRYINLHPNEEITVEEGLYKAFSQIVESGDRSLYLGPVYDRYDDLFTCTEDFQAVDFDPYHSEDVAREYAEIAAFANDKNAVDLELLGENTLRLRVSGEYLAYAKENGITTLIDFFWMRNAFIADYLADVLVEAGYTRGYLMSFDGFVRNLDRRGTDFAFTVQDRMDSAVYPAASLHYTGPTAIVYYHNYPVSQKEQYSYYTFENGEIRTPYLDPADGLCKSALNDLVCYGRDLGCAQILLETRSLYVAEDFRPEELTSLRDKGIQSLYCKDRTVLYTEKGLSLSNLYRENGLEYGQELIP